MVVRVSRRFGPFRLSAFESGRAYGGTYRYDEAEDVLDAVQVNWPKRVAIIAGAMTPAWVTFGLGWPLMAFVLAFGAAVGLISAIRRTELAYGCNARRFGAWCGAVVVGIVFAVLAGMLVSAVVASARAAETQPREDLPKAKEAAWVSAVQNLKTADGSTVLQALQFAEKMRPSKFKFGDMGGAYSGQPLRPMGISIEYWIGAKRLDGDSFAFLFRVDDSSGRPVVDVDHAPPHGFKGSAQSLMEGRDALLAMIDEDYRMDCIGPRTSEKLC